MCALGSVASDKTSDSVKFASTSRLESKMISTYVFGIVVTTTCPKI